MYVSDKKRLKVSQKTLMVDLEMLRNHKNEHEDNARLNYN